MTVLLALVASVHGEHAAAAAYSPVRAPGRPAHGVGLNPITQAKA